MDPKITNFRASFGAILGAVLGPDLALKGDQKWDQFWNPLAPHLRGRGVAILRIQQEWWGIAMATGIIFDKRKGGIKTLRAL